MCCCVWSSSSSSSSVEQQLSCKAECCKARKRVGRASRLAVDNKQTMLSYCIPESNSLGVALLAEDTKSIEELVIRADKFDVLLLLENDLHLSLDP